jgi:hypothetical protein
MPDNSPYDDIGAHGRPTPYDDCGHVKCPVCGAVPGKRCVNPVTGKPRKGPCIGRVVRTSTVQKRQEEK